MRKKTPHQQLGTPLIPNLWPLPRLLRQGLAPSGPQRRLGEGEPKHTNIHRHKTHFYLVALTNATVNPSFFRGANPGSLERT